MYNLKFYKNEQENFQVGAGHAGINNIADSHTSMALRCMPDLVLGISHPVGGINRRLCLLCSQGRYKGVFQELLDYAPEHLTSSPEWGAFFLFIQSSP